MTAPAPAAPAEECWLCRGQGGLCRVCKCPDSPGPGKTCTKGWAPPSEDCGGVIVPCPACEVAALQEKVGRQHRLIEGQEKEHRKDLQRLIECQKQSAEREARAEAAEAALERASDRERLLCQQIDHLHAELSQARAALARKEAPK